MHIAKWGLGPAHIPIYLGPVFSEEAGHWYLQHFWAELQIYKGLIQVDEVLATIELHLLHHAITACVLL